jgi:hypothetical protein
MVEKLMIASFAEKNKLEAVGSNQVLDCAKLGFAYKLTVSYSVPSFDALSGSVRAAPWLSGCVAGGEIPRGWAERKCTKRLRYLEADGSKKASDTETVDRSMTQVGTRCEAGEEGAWQQLGWTRGKPGCTRFENPANLLKSFRLREKR